jgi:hypothetical protein
MTRTRLQTTCLALACFAAALACQKPEPPAPAKASESSVTTNSAAPAAPIAPIAPVVTAPSVDLETLPAREDFEQEASAAITPANLEKQLAALEKEMAAD